MGTTINGIYVPDPGETGWGTSVSNNMRRLADIAVNVKAYGAVGDGSADDTSAITNAITAAYASGGSVYFPAPVAYYKVTSTIDLSQKPGLYLLGGGSKLSPTQFNRAPRIPIIAATNFGPVFKIWATLSADSDGVTFENLDIHAGLPLHIKNMNVFKAKNCAFNSWGSTVGANATGVLVENGFWHWYQDCTFFAPASGATNYGMILRGLDAPLMTSDTCNLMTWNNCIFAYGGIQYSQVYAAGAQEGNFRFDGCTSESMVNGSAFFDYTANGMIRYIGNIDLRNHETADATGSHALMRVVCGGGGGLIAGNFQNCRNHTRVVEVSGANVYYSTFNQVGDFFPVVDSSGNQYPYGGSNFQSGKADGVHIYGAQASGLPPKLFIQNETNTAVELYSDAASLLKTNANIAQAGAGTYHEFLENGTTDAAAGAANTGRLFVKDNGAGKTQLCVRFNTGAVQVLATEP